MELRSAVVHNTGSIVSKSLHCVLKRVLQLVKCTAVVSPGPSGSTAAEGRGSAASAAGKRELVLQNREAGPWWRGRPPGPRGLRHPVCRLRLPPMPTGWLGPRMHISLPSFRCAALKAIIHAVSVLIAIVAISSVQEFYCNAALLLTSHLLQVFPLPRLCSSTPP